METNALSVLVVAIARSTTTFVAILQETRCPIIAEVDDENLNGKISTSFDEFTHPVETMRLSRTMTAPTRRFMQFERWEASEARVC